MAVSYVGTGSGSVPVANNPMAEYPSIQAGDLLITAIANNPNIPNIPSGWTQIGQKTAGAGSAGAGSGMILIIYFR